MSHQQSFFLLGEKGQHQFHSSFARKGHHQSSSFLWREGNQKSPSPLGGEGRGERYSKSKKLIVLADFDGTITKKDVCYLLLERYAQFYWQGLDREWIEGKISTEDAYRELLKRIDIKKEEFDRFIDSIEIDEDFKRFFIECKKNNVEVEVVSDGLDYYIKRIFEREGLGEIPFYSNGLKFKGNEMILRFKKEYHEICPRKKNPCGFCKKTIVDAKKKEGYKVIFIGDGPSDRCPASEADIVFAKGFLKSYCEENKILFYEFKDFKDVLKIMSKIPNLILNSKRTPNSIL